MVAFEMCNSQQAKMAYDTIESYSHLVVKIHKSLMTDYFTFFYFQHRCLKATQLSYF